MSSRDEQLDQVRYAAASLLPGLTERLARSGLGALEVRDGELRVRVVAAAGSSPTVGISARRSADDAPSPALSPPGSSAASAPPGERHAVVSPAVGFFLYAEALGPGLEVEKGDPLGHVEMLGVQHEVRAPRSGRVSNLVTESGEPVEYGQLLVEMEPAG